MIIFILLLFSSSCALGQGAFDDNIALFDTNMGVLKNFFPEYQKKKIYSVESFDDIVKKINSSIDLLNKLWHIEVPSNNNLSLKQKRFFDHYGSQWEKKFPDKINFSFAISMSEGYIKINREKISLCRYPVGKESDKAIYPIFLTEFNFDHEFCKNIFSFLVADENNFNRLQLLEERTISLLKIILGFYNKKPADFSSINEDYKVFLNKICSCFIMFHLDLFILKDFLQQNPCTRLPQNWQIYELDVDNSRGLAEDIKWWRNVRIPLLFWFDTPEQIQDYNLLVKNNVRFDISKLDQIKADDRLKTVLESNETIFFNNHKDSHVLDFLDKKVEAFLSTQEAPYELDSQLVKNLETGIQITMQNFYENFIKLQALAFRQKDIQANEFKKQLQKKQQLMKKIYRSTGAVLFLIAAYAGFKNRSQLASLYHKFMKSIT